MKINWRMNMDVRAVKKPSMWRDSSIVLILTILAFLFSSKLELNERVIEWTQPLEAYQADELLTTFIAMIGALSWFWWRRSRQVLEQLNLRLAAQQELATVVEENRLLSQRYVELQESERRNIARELHDELGQCLTAMRVDAVNIREQSVENSVLRASAEAVVELSAQVYDVVRNLTHRLRPVALDELGLCSAVEYLVEEWQRRHHDVFCDLKVDGDFTGLGESLNITVYRVVQECLTNIEKHSHAKNITIEMIHKVTKSGIIELTVSDDGNGFDMVAPRQGLGLIGIRERIVALGGRLSVNSKIGEGVCITAVIPRGDEDGTT